MKTSKVLSNPFGYVGSLGQNWQRRLPLWGWMRKNLFASSFDTALSFVLAFVLFHSLWPIYDWAIAKASLSGSTREACTADGACWTFIKMRLDQFMFGFYPAGERWRVVAALSSGVLGIVYLLWPKLPKKWAAATIMSLPYPLAAVWMLAGGWGLAPVETELWGGMMLTVILATVGITASLPMGVMLALGRRSELPIVRTLSVSFIELWRGVPLITVLFMSSVMLPLFLPVGWEVNKLLRALIGITLFSAAYMAEVVRGGLQAIPKGQYEAASALGLSYWKTTGFVILPQALKLVIPGIVNTFIGLFKDTTLILVIGLFDLLGIVQAALTDPKWLGFSTEGYVFVASFFWVICYSMSKYSQALEARLKTTH